MSARPGPDALLELIRAGGLPLPQSGIQFPGRPLIVHEHAPTRTMGEARENLAFDVARIVKTIAFVRRAPSGKTLVLAALRGTRRVDYAKLAGLCGVNRRDLAALSPAEVLERVGVEPGGVSPLHGHPALGLGALLLIDEDALGIAPTLYCGSGRPDRTLELAPADLLALSGGRPGAFSR
ncbi:MAG: YbaK/EbsC family protein [Desulfovibrio sp.]|jgi:Cys-tRNA(Pro)/Cys-tRNA(Cys) deacylase|nr:YbaK/EbsC family protein [Desulfovibrio sp.]